MRDLKRIGKIHIPETSKKLVEDLEAISSPVKFFIRECCEINQDLSIATDDLFDVYSQWCQREGIRNLDKSNFVKEFRAASDHKCVVKQRRNSTGQRFRSLTGVGLSQDGKELKPTF